MAKRQGLGSFRPKLISIAVASCFVTSTALANPTGPTVVNGTAAILQTGNLLQVTNSPSAIINWQSFSIGASEITRFIQQSQASAVLNRVTGSAGVIDPSVILGALQSNGRVFLINPSGILFGAGAQIDVAGLVASSLKLSDADFLGNRMRFTDGIGAGNVTNLAKPSIDNPNAGISTPSGGSVYLVGNSVTNKGIITSPQGEVILAAGNSVELVNPGTPNLRVEIAAADNEARNLGQIISDAGRIGIYAGLINNSGSIRADSAVSEGGRILLKATKSTTLENSSVLSAQGQGGGEIKVLAGDTVNVAGRLDASAPNGGDGGFIETSASRVQIAPSHIITTAAPHGKTGTWLIDPNDFYIGTDCSVAPTATCDITGTQLSSDLNLTSVVIVSDDGATRPDTNGDIFVNDSVSWSSVNSLTLTARRDVRVNNSITNASTGNILLNAGWNDTTPAGDPSVIPGVGDIVLASSVSVDTEGSVFFQAGRDITLNSGSTVRAGLETNISGNRTVDFFAGRNISLTSSSVRASARTLSGNEGNAIVSFTAGGAISVDSSNVHAFADNGSPGGAATVNLAAAGSGITIGNGSAVLAFGGRGTELDGGTATINLCAGSLDGNLCTPSSAGGITVANSQVTAAGGQGSGFGGDALVQLVAGSGGIQVAGIVSLGSDGEFGNGTILAKGGSGNNSGGAATVTLNTTGGITVGDTTNGGAGIAAIGGNASSASFNSNPANATVRLVAAGGITVQNASAVEARGGNISSGSGQGGNALVELCAGTFSLGVCTASPAGGITVNASRVRAQGGNASSGNSGGTATVKLTAGSSGITIQDSDSGPCSDASRGIFACGGFGGARGGEAIITLATTGPITVDSSLLEAVGGDGSGSGGNATVRLDSAGGITVNNAFIVATAGSGEGSGDAFVGIRAAGIISITGDGETDTVEADGRTAIVTIAGPLGVDESPQTSDPPQNRAASVTINNATVRANADGAEGSVFVFATGGISVTTSNLRADTDSSFKTSAVNINSSAGLVMLTDSHILANDGRAEVILRGGNIEVTNGATIRAEGEPSALVRLEATGFITLTDSEVSATVSNTCCFVPATVELLAGSGDITINGGNVSALGLNTSGISAVRIDSTGGSINIGTTTGTNIRADGAEGAMVSLTAPAGITVTNSTLEAVTTNSFSEATVGLISTSGAINLTNSTINVLTNSSSAESLVQISAAGGITVDGGSINTYANSGNASILLTTSGAGAPINILNSAQLNADGDSEGNGLVSLTAAGSITVGGNITTTGSGGGGIELIAGDKIIGAGGVLSADSDTDITLTAVNGIGTPTNPVRTTSPDVFFSNSGAAGDIAFSVVGGGVTAVGGDFTGLFNANPNGTYFIQLESGNFSLSVPFLPGETVAAPLLSGQSLVVKALAGNVVIDTGGSIETFGTGSTTLTGTNVTQNAGSNLSGLLNATATSGNVNLSQAAGYTLGLLSATGSVSVNSTLGDILINSGGSIATSGLVNATATASNVVVNGGTLSAPSGTISMTGSSIDIVGGASVTGNNVTLAGGTGTVNITGSSAIATNLMTVGAGTLNVMGPGTALLQGANVDITAVTAVNVTANGGSAKIVSTLPTTIFLDFPALSSGGYFVNGVEGAITDGSSGFFAGGSSTPAILGQNLIVTYGVVSSQTPPIFIFIDQVVVANNLNFDILADQLRGGEAGEGPPVEAKKELPVCK